MILEEPRYFFSTCVDFCEAHLSKEWQQKAEKRNRKHESFGPKSLVVIGEGRQGGQSGKKLLKFLGVAVCFERPYKIDLLAGFSAEQNIQ